RSEEGPPPPAPSNKILVPAPDRSPAARHTIAAPISRPAPASGPHAPATSRAIRDRNRGLKHPCAAAAGENLPPRPRQKFWPGRTETAQIHPASRCEEQPAETVLAVPTVPSKYSLDRKSILPAFAGLACLKLMELMIGIEPMTSPLPRECSTN